MYLLKVISKCADLNQCAGDIDKWNKGGCRIISTINMRCEHVK